jgi:alkanesulfonate monooxygenase SsuD/methylene tetrahydromethanopterin reductase-like flavin-dependent oxidoreductase (luciferase family)
VKVYHFSETPYPHVDQARADGYATVRVGLPNRYYDPVKGREVYRERLDDWCLADELGLEIVMNEHHQTPTCTVPAVPIMAGILARQTRRARLLVLGNPIAHRRQPLRVAEEMAMVDVISGGRLECGFVRGVPYENHAINSNGMRMDERFWEAHDLILKAWTSHDDAISWEGRHFHHRQINIWPRPYQQPHPPIWITTSTPSTAERLGRLGYVTATFLTGFAGAKAVFDAYRAGWRAVRGTEAPPDRFGFLGFGYTADTDAEARLGGEKLTWYLAAGRTQNYLPAPGYLSAAAVVAASKESGLRMSPTTRPDVDTQIEVGNMFIGTPDTVFRRIKEFHAHVGGLGHLLLMGHAGPMTHAEVARSLTLFAREVLPRVRELDSAPAAAAQ